MRGFIRLAAPCTAALILSSATPGPVRFESRPRAVATGTFPQIGVRVTGDVSLLTVEGGDLWYLTSPDGGDSFPQRVRVNETPHEVAAHGENIPILVLRSMRELYVLWQGRAGGEGSVLRLARSADWGLTFSKPVPVDARSESPGFYTMAVSPQGVVYVAWLESAGLHVARSTNRGQSFEPGIRVASGVCPCCRPSLAFADSGTVYVSWRGVSHGDVRDIQVASSADGAAWSQPAAIAEDNWRLNACPHSGASLAVVGSRLFVAWHTVREGTAQVYLAWSDDDGKTFSPRANLRGAVMDANHPRLVARAGKIGAVFQGRDPNDNVGWGKQNVYYREIAPDGSLSDLVNAGHLEGSATYPELLYEEPDHVFVAWHENGDGRSRVVLVRGRTGGNSAN